MSNKTRDPPVSGGADRDLPSPDDDEAAAAGAAVGKSPTFPFAPPYCRRLGECLLIILERKGSV